MTEPHTEQDHTGEHDIGGLVRRAYWTSVDIETASRHLWRLHRAAAAPVPVRGVRRTLVSALAAVLLFATAGTAVALSTSAVPGDSLYTVKRGAERLHLLVSFAPESDARLHLRFARSRIGEAQSVASTRPETVPDLLSEIVASVDRATEVGGTSLAEEVELVRLEASTALSSLGGGLDADLAASVDDAIRALGGEAVAASSAPDPAGGAAPPGAGADQPAAAPGGADAPAADGQAARPPAPDRAAPAPPTPLPAPSSEAPGEDGEQQAAGDADAEDAEDGEQRDDGGAGEQQPEQPAAAATAPAPGREAGTPGPSPPPAAPEPGTEEIAADSTMPTLERLEGLLRRP